MLFDMFIVLYLFLGGCVAGLMLLTSLRSLVNNMRKGESRIESAAFERYVGICYAVALVLAVASVTCLVCDLGNPLKVLVLFVRPRLNAISIGVYVLSVTLILLAVLCAAEFLLRHDARGVGAVRRIAEILAVPVALALMSYTGVFLALIESVPLWHTPLTVVLFVLSALSAGYALSSLVRGLSDSGSRVTVFRVPSHRGHACVIILEILAVAAFAVQAVFRPEVAVARSIRLALAEPLFGWLVGGVVVLGLAVPLVTELALLRAAKKPGGVFGWGNSPCIPADLACLLGCFLLRYCLVAAGLH